MLQSRVSRGPRHPPLLPYIYIYIYDILGFRVYNILYMAHTHIGPRHPPGPAGHAPGRLPRPLHHAKTHDDSVCCKLFLSQEQDLRSCCP